LYLIWTVQAALLLHDPLFTLIKAYQWHLSNFESTLTTIVSPKMLEEARLHITSANEMNFGLPKTKGFLMVKSGKAESLLGMI